MKQSLALSLPIAVFGALLTAIPGHLIPVCAVLDGAAPMRCHWSGEVLTGFGVLFFGVGALLFFCRSSGVRTGVSAATLLSAVLAGAVPTKLVGLCAMPDMQCRIGTYPAVMIALAAVALASVFNIVFLRRQNQMEQRPHETVDNHQPRPSES